MLIGDRKESFDSLSDSDDLLMQSSIIGHISKLELHEKEQNRVGFDAKTTDKLRYDLVSDLEKKVESSEYCIVEADRETKDGWLVVIDQ